MPTPTTDQGETARRLAKQLHQFWRALPAPIDGGPDDTALSAAIYFLESLTADLAQLRAEHEGLRQALEEAERVARFARLFQQAARDETLSDLEARNVARFLSLDSITEKEIRRGQELAEKYGWLS